MSHIIRANIGRLSVVIDVYPSDCTAWERVCTVRKGVDLSTLNLGAATIDIVQHKNLSPDDAMILSDLIKRCVSLADWLDGRVSHDDTVTEDEVRAVWDESEAGVG